MFPNLYKKKKVVYDDFSKIYLTNIKNSHENIQNDNTNKETPLTSLNNKSQRNNENNNNCFPRETIKNSFMYSFKGKFSKKLQTLYNNSKNKRSNSPVVNCGTGFELNEISVDTADNFLIMTNYVSIR
jgi:hypothetical protein